MTTLVDDLRDGRIQAVGAKPPSNHENRSSVLSGTCFVQYSSVQVRATVTNSVLSCYSAVNSMDFNANYLHFKDQRTTVANMDIHRPLVISGNFSGCEYRVFKAEYGFVCAHIARPAGVGSDALMSLLDSYAGQKDWTEVQRIGSMGHIHNARGCTEVMMVSGLNGNSVESILLEINGVGNIVGTSDYQSTAI